MFSALACSSVVSNSLLCNQNLKRYDYEINYWRPLSNMAPNMAVNYDANNGGSKFGACFYYKVNGLRL